MKIQLRLHNHLLHLLIILVLIASATSFSAFRSSDDDDESEDPRSLTTCKIKRQTEIQRECGAILSLASKTKPKSDQIFGIGRGFSFHNGDWVQETGGAGPLMPFDETDMPNNFSSVASKNLKLASFWVTGFDFAQRINSSIPFCGILNIGITRNRTLNYMPGHWHPWFHTSPGYSVQTMLFEGVFVESEENGGEGLMCLLGSSLSPFSKNFVNFYQNSMSGSCQQNFESKFTQDDKIRLLLRYPKNFTLTSRSIIGEMKSLNSKTDPKYFDTVQISSHLGHDSNTYQFVSDQLVSKACNPYPYQDETIDEEVEIFKGFRFCKVIRSFGSETFDIIRVHKSNGTKNNFGPFLIDGTSEVIGKYKLIISGLRCVQGDGVDKLKSARVSAVFRLVSSLEDRWSTAERTGLSGMTISAEGIWNSSSGQLCMVGCLGTETGENGCNSRICMYFPTVFSVTQRSILRGSFSSIKKTDPYTTLSFRKELHPFALWNQYDEYSKSYLSYNYTKTEMTHIHFNTNKNSDLLGVLMKKMFKYSDIEDYKNKTQLSSLSAELGFSVFATSNSMSKTHLSNSVVRLEILSLGPLLGRYWSWSREKYSCKRKDDMFNAGSSSNTIPLNISAQLSFTGESYSHISEMFVEGIYVPVEGKLYLIGCRKLNFKKKMDCLIKVQVKYSSKTLRWLVNPNAKVSVTSQREINDPLYFSPISITTALIPYKDNSGEVIFRLNFESGFRMLMLLASIIWMLSQLLYVQNKVDVVPFISSTMLCIQVLGYVIPLITESVILFKWKEYSYRENRLMRSAYNTRIQNSLQGSMKFIILIAFVLTLRLYQKVWKSRGFGHKPKNFKVKPREQRVVFSTIMIHVIGFMACFVNNNTKATFGIELEKYTGLVQDLFLLPQVIGNIIWDIQRVKALSKVYYLGFTVLRLLIRGYDCLREPVFDVNWHKNDSVVGSEFFSKYEGIGIMVIVVVLAVIVHAQQMR